MSLARKEMGIVSDASGKKPNVILFMCDSLAPHFSGPYGDRAGSTPHIDRMAAQGVVFDNAYCNSPICAASRASMMTGRYVSDLGALDNANEFLSEWPTMGHMFKRAGYETAIIGKMHFFGHDQYHGFEERLARMADYATGFDISTLRLAYDWTQPSGGNPAGPDWMGPSYVRSDKWDYYPHHYDFDETIHDAAKAYLSGKSEADRPFFCCISFHQPHNPFWIPEHIRDRFKDKELPLPDIPDDIEDSYGIMDRWLNDFHYVPDIVPRVWEKDNLRWLYETYYGMTYDMDRRIGELLDLLQEKGLDRNTALVFVSDHGEMLGHRGMIQKRCFYDKSVKIPMVFSFPGKWKMNVRRAGPVSLLDLLPTFAELAGAEPPEGLPGTSLLPSVTGDEEPGERIIFAEYHGEGVHAPCFMAQSGPYKYIYVHEYEERLFDVAQDPDECRNVIGEAAYRPVAAELKAWLLGQFNPDEIKRRGLQSQRNRKYVYDSERQ